MVMISHSDVARAVDSPWVSRFVMAVVVFNALLLGLETSERITARFGGLINLLDQICLSIFVVEIIAKLIAHRLNFFKSGWNIFDFIIVAIALMPGGGGLSVLRALRIMRLLRVVSVSPNLRRVVEAFVSALPGMASVLLLMSMIYYIAAVIATKMFGSSFPDWFGTLGTSAYTLFQVMTLESWSMGIVRPVMEVYPHAWLFFVPFILSTTFAVMNLVVGLVVNSMQDAHDAEDDANTADYRDDVVARLAAIEAQLAQIAAQNQRKP